MSFVERRLSAAIKLAPDTQTNQPNVFAGTQSDSVTLAGSRMSLRVQNSGATAGSNAQLSVWGLTPSLMNQLATLGMVLQLIPRNTVTVAAGDAGGGMAAVFVGTIIQAYADYNQAPDVPFRFECLSGAAEGAIPYPASSYTGATDVATILSTIARNQGWGFENSGVDVKLSSPYLSGSAMTQVRAVAEHAHINASLINNVLCIWPRYGARESVGGIPLLAPPPVGQMIGYPSFTQQGIMVRSVFDPRVIFGGQIKVESSIFTTQSLARMENVSSLWNVYKLDLALDALMPRGEWASTIYGYNPRYPAPIPR